MNNCGKCLFFNAFVLKREEGTCRRNPPQVLINKWGDLKTEFPVVSVNFWCGEHKEKTK